MLKDIKLNLFEKVVIKLFYKTFAKMYKKGLVDSFNLLSAPPSHPYADYT